MKVLRSAGFYLALVVCAALAYALYRVSLLDLQFQFQGSDYEILRPRWLLAFSIAPLFAYAATQSLADLPSPQRWLGVLLRAALAAALTLAVARLARTTEVTRISTIFLVDVSESITDEAIEDGLRAAQEAYAGRGDNNVQLISFAEVARAVPLAEDGEPRSLSAADLRHEDGRATDLQLSLIHI